MPGGGGGGRLAPCEEESRDCGGVAEVKEHKRRPAHPELGVRYGAESPFQSQKEPSCQYLHFKLVASGTVRHISIVEATESVALNYGALGQEYPIARGVHPEANSHVAG